MRILLLGVCAFSCGSDSGMRGMASDASTKDAAVLLCKAVPSYPDFGSNVRGYGLDYPQKTTGSATTAHAQVVVQTLDASDVMFMQLNAEFGAFGSGEIVPGNYVIAGDDIDPAICGVCVNIWPSSLTGTMLNADATYLMNEQYIAVAGTVTLSTAGGSANGSNTISGSVTNLSFKHAIVQPDGSFQYAPDGCVTSLGSGRFGPYKLAPGGSGSSSAAMQLDPVEIALPPEAVKLRHRSAG